MANEILKKSPKEKTAMRWNHLMTTLLTSPIRVMKSLRLSSLQSRRAMRRTNPKATPTIGSGRRKPLQKPIVRLSRTLAVLILAGAALTSPLWYNLRLAQAAAWFTRTNMPTARNSAAAAEINGKIYVVGGESSGGVFNTL